MIIETEIVAQKYAVAFCNLYGKTLSEELLQRARALADFFKNNKNIVACLMVPSISEEKKQNLIERIIKQFKLGKEFTLLMIVLLQHKRIKMFDLVVRHIIKQYLKTHSIYPVSIYTSHPLSETERQPVIDFVKRELPHQTIKADFFVDPELISGIRIKGETFLWERSIHKLLRDIRRTMLQQVGL